MAISASSLATYGRLQVSYCIWYGGCQDCLSSVDDLQYSELLLITVMLNLLTFVYLGVM
jgi:hypothetical protein